ncbi:uncharacterized protein LOC144952028 [Lampetra fluviatilis]
MSRIAEAYAENQPLHTAAQSRLLQANYTRAMVELLLSTLVPPPTLSTRSGRAIVRELITCNVLLPTLNRMSDPDWINQMIVMLMHHPAPDTAPAGPPSPPVTPDGGHREPPANTADHHDHQHHHHGHHASRRSSISVIVTDESDAAATTTTTGVPELTDPPPGGAPASASAPRRSRERDDAAVATAATAATAATFDPMTIGESPGGREAGGPALTPSALTPSALTPSALTPSALTPPGGRREVAAAAASLEVQATEQMVEEAVDPARRCSAASGLDEAEEAEFFSLGSDEESPADSQRQLPVGGSPAHPAAPESAFRRPPDSPAPVAADRPSPPTDRRRRFAARIPGRPVGPGRCRSGVATRPHGRPLIFGGADGRSDVVAVVGPASPESPARCVGGGHGFFRARLSPLTAKKFGASCPDQSASSAASSSSSAPAAAASASSAAASASSSFGAHKETSNIFHFARSPPVSPDDGAAPDDRPHGAGPAPAPSAVEPLPTVARLSPASPTALNAAAGGGGVPHLPTTTGNLPPSPPEALETIQNLRIVGTLTAREHRGTGSHPYTLYTIKPQGAPNFEIVVEI